MQHSDAFVSHPAFVEDKTPGPAGILSGVPAHDLLQTQSGVIDFELDASTYALESLIFKLYFRIISFNHRDNVAVLKGALAHRKGLCLVAFRELDNQVTVE